MSKLHGKPSALKREHPALQKMKINNFFLFLWDILPPNESGSNTLVSACKIRIWTRVIKLHLNCEKYQLRALTVKQVKWFKIIQNPKDPVHRDGSV
jgi:hypothetical protein